MDKNGTLSRRTMIRTLGAGATLAGLGLFTAAAAEEAGAVAVAGELPQPFALPPLGFALGALEPAIDARTMEIHHGKHHQGYVNNANMALADHSELQAWSAETLLRRLSEVPAGIREAVRNNVGGHANHSLFWRVLQPGGRREPSGALASALARDFGTLSEFQAQFAKAASTRFGSGWAWLSAGPQGLVVHSTANQDSPLSDGLTPLLGLDVWEHAYYLNYQNRRAAYIEAFWSLVNWTVVGEHFRAAV
ncbi:MAG: hypothetical protein RIS54_1683 [Verrucomicrobiota bacterium]|jgi:Fe-Mn family superoxide dismutase